MKKIIAFILFLIISELSFGQQTASSPGMTSADYLKKSKHQNKVGLILVLGGSACALVGSVLTVIIAKSLEAGAVVMVIGLVSIPASIPFFIAAHKNKKKAISLSFKKENVPKIQYGTLSNHPIPSLSLKLSL